MKPIKLKKSQWWIMTLICILIGSIIVYIFWHFNFYEKVKIISFIECPGSSLCIGPLKLLLGNPLALLLPMGIFIAICYPIFTKIFDISDLE